MYLPVETILQYTIAAGFLALIYSYFTGKQILSSSPGNAKNARNFISYSGRSKGLFK